MPCSPQTQRRGEKEEAPAALKPTPRPLCQNSVNVLPGCIRGGQYAETSRPQMNGPSCKVTASITPRAEKQLKKQFGNQSTFSNMILLHSNPSELKSHSGIRAVLEKKGRESGQSPRSSLPVS